MNIMKAKHLIYAGLILFVVSIIYDVIFIGIQFQDPTPKMIENRNYQYMIKDLIFWSGLIVLVLGVIGWVIKKIK